MTWFNMNTLTFQYWDFSKGFLKKSLICEIIAINVMAADKEFESLNKTSPMKNGVGVNIKK